MEFTSGGYGPTAGVYLRRSNRRKLLRAV